MYQTISDILVFLNVCQALQFDKPSYVMVRRLPFCFVGKCLVYFRGLCVISFRNIQKYAFVDLFSSLLTITNSFGKFAV